MKKLKNNKDGFTLIEIIISIALIGIIAIALMSGISYSTKVLFSSGQFMDKNYEIQVELENFNSGDVNNPDYVALVKDVTFEIKWNGSTLEDFSVTGKSMEVDSDSLVQDETFYVFITESITMSNPK